MDLAAPAVMVTRRGTFAAAHILRRAEWSDARNLEVFGACAGDHGHNYQIEVTVRGRLDPETGMVVNLKDLDRVLHSCVIDRVDHRHLNRDVPFLEGLVPTAENLALAFWRVLEAALPDLCLERVRLVESENNSAEVHR